MSPEERIGLLQIGVDRITAENDHRHAKIIGYLQDYYLEGAMDAASILGDEDLRVAAEALTYRLALRRTY